MKMHIPQKKKFSPQIFFKQGRHFIPKIGLMTTVMSSTYRQTNLDQPTKTELHVWKTLYTCYMEFVTRFRASEVYWSCHVWHLHWLIQAEHWFIISYVVKSLLAMFSFLACVHSSQKDSFCFSWACKYSNLCNLCVCVCALMWGEIINTIAQKVYHPWTAYLICRYTKEQVPCCFM